jgi:hypothetical protein
MLFHPILISYVPNIALLGEEEMFPALDLKLLIKEEFWICNR